MTASPVVSVMCHPLTILLVFGIATGPTFAEDGTSVAELPTELSASQVPESENDLPVNRVLPVDAEHKSKITFHQQALDPICVQTMRENLLKFLKRVRKGRQDDGDDGDDGDGEGAGGLAGVIGGLTEGNGALSTLAMVQAIVPQLVTTLTQLSGAVNQGLNGTDTPNLPSFFIKQGQQLFQALTSNSGSQRVPAPSAHIVQPIPGATPPRKPRPPSPSYEIPEDYVDEDVRQPIQPNLRPSGVGLERPRPADYDPYPGNPFLENNEIRRPAPTTPDPNVETLNGLPPKTSLWQIYKSFRTRSQGNGSLSDFQLAHPEAFSNELLQSLSQAFSNVRGQGSNAAIPTDKPSSEIFKQFYPPGQSPQPSIFSNLDRPKLSVYKPSSGASGVGVDLSNLALNASMNQIEPVKPSATNSQEEDATPSASIQQELETDSVASLGVAQSKPGGSGGAVRPTKPPYNFSQNVATLGTLAQLQAQQAQALINKIQANPNQFVKSPTSSLLTIPVGEYISSVYSLHETEEDLQNIGPQTNHEDSFNGIRNKMPYVPVKGVLLEAPRLTPSPLFASKPPSNLFIGDQVPVQPTQFPEFSFQSSNLQPGSGSSSLFPPNANVRPGDPNPPRAPTLIAAISSNFPQFSQLNNNGILPPSLISQTYNPVPQSQSQSEQIGSSTNPSATGNPEEAEPNQPEEDLSSPGTNKPGNKFVASSLANLATSSISQHSSPSNNVAGEASSNAPVPQATEESSPVTEDSNPPQTQNAELLLYLLQNFPHLLLGQNANVNAEAAPAQEPQNEVAPATEAEQVPTTPVPEETTQAVSEETVASTIASEPAVKAPSNNALQNALLSQFSNLGSAPFAPQVVQEPNNAAELQVSTLPPVQSVSTDSPEDSSQQQQQSLQNNELPFGGLIQGSSSSVSDVRNETEIEVETTTTAKLNGDLPIIPNFAESLQFPSAPIQSNLLQAPVNEPSQIIGESTESSAIVPSDEQTPSSTIASILISPENNKQSVSSSSDSELPNLSHLYGNSPPETIPQAHPEPESEQNSADLEILTSTTSTAAPVVQHETLPPLNYQHLNGFPDTIPSLPASGSPNPPLPPATDVKPLIIEDSSFQGPGQIDGNPAHLTNAPSASAALASSFGSGFQSPSSGPSFAPVDSSSTSNIVYINNRPVIKPAFGAFGHKLASSISTSAIAEMAKLPYFQLDSFRPSVLPPSITGVQKEEDSFEQVEPETERPISEIFSSANNLSGNAAESSTSKIIIMDVKNPSVPLDNDSVEQIIPNFPPGKPIYWMNMYYPNGVPVLTRVKTTTVPTTMKPRKRRRRTTTQPPSTTTTATEFPEAEYYEEEDLTKPKRKKYVVVDFE